MNNRKLYFRQYQRDRKSGFGRYRKRRSWLEAKNLWAALNFYRKCGKTVREMSGLTGGISASTINYYLNDPRCKANAL